MKKLYILATLGLLSTNLPVYAYQLAPRPDFTPNQQLTTAQLQFYNRNAIGCNIKHGKAVNETTAAISGTCKDFLTGKTVHSRLVINKNSQVYNNNGRLSLTFSNSVCTANPIYCKISNL
ncbi:MAG: hypothetical protein V4525_08805 [Pseudomonadota bacterium]